jgi:hypothetical protein
MLYAYKHGVYEKRTVVINHVKTVTLDAEGALLISEKINKMPV